MFALLVQDPTSNVSSLIALVTAIGAAAGVFLTYLKQAREQGAKDKAQEANIATAAAQAGVNILTGGMEALQSVIQTMSLQLGEVRGQLKDCKEERQTLQEHTKVLDEMIAAQGARIAELERLVAQ